MNNGQRLAAAILSLAAITGVLSSELEPCKASSDAYDLEVDRRIDDAVMRRARLSIAILPSFEGESGIRLSQDAVHFVQFQESLWAKEALERAAGRYGPPTIAVTVSRSPISRDLANRIEKTFAQAVARAAKPGRLIVDGTTYRILANGACGQARSLEPGSMATKVIELVSLLQDHAKSDRRHLQRSERAIAGLLATIR